MNNLSAIPFEPPKTLKTLKAAQARRN